ncbi:MAG: Sua5/YciO/YrdC/YwlC family protein, partial [Deltaproteobacteria bacterium]|nr:Sua5/YciO/YrdC/YwlC family protein [Deltaproteobacteria bacterium]
PLLLSPARPIVLLGKKSPEALSPLVAPDNRNLGIMLPYTPLHHLIFTGGIDALVMTSANFSEEPIVISEADARERLRELADFILAHNRRILNRADDSVMRVFGGCGRFLRRSRGFVPVPIFLKFTSPPVLAVGGELKNTICVTKGDRAYPSQYVGDLENPLAISFFEEAVGRIEKCVDVEPEIIVHDMHPEYTSTKYALERNCATKISIQHHHAHILSVLAEQRLDEPVIGIAIDGTGYGMDGNIWGSEVLLVDKNNVERLSHLGYLPLPGGEKAIRENWRTGLALLYMAFGEESLELIRKFEIFEATADRRKNSEKLLRLLHDGYGFPLSCGMGRYFDGISALIGLVDRNAFE